jgi:tRNA-specific 2-thiouridylase
MNPLPQDREASEPRRIVVAMSGGVDSSVAAALLREAGHEVIGITLKLQGCYEPGASRSCCSIDGIDRARAAAGQLGVPHYVIDCVREFGEQVLRPAWEEYARGRTPSPCLLCNERIKFGLLLSRARELGATRVATGHYARVAADARGEPVLLRGVDRDKDQSYFLAGLTPEQLGAVGVPIGDLRKTEVRAKARALGLATAGARESQDACLVGPDESFAEMLRLRFGAESRPGPIVGSGGAVLGRHPGLHHFTIGQRRGLALSSGGRHWVKGLRAEDAAVVVTGDEGELFADRFTAVGMSWCGGGAASDRPGRCHIQIRYRHTAQSAEVERTGPASIRAIFDAPVRAITPGQAAVLYDGERVLGRGWIDTVGWN